MKAEELRKLKVEDLEKKQTDFDDELFKLKMQDVTGQLENVSKIGVVRKNIARVKTLINEKKREEATK